MKPMAPDPVRFELIQWARDGAPITAWSSRIEPIMKQYCVSCHAPDSALPDFNKFENVQKVAAVDEGASVGSLTRFSHIHLFGIAFIFFFVGWIFSFAQYPTRWKLILIATPLPSCCSTSCPGGSPSISRSSPG